MKKWCYILWMILWAHQLRAEEPPVETIEAQVAEISVVALGSSPVRVYQKSKNGPSVLLDFAPFRTPPTRLFFTSEGAKNPLQVPVYFNQQGGFVQVPADRELTLYRGNPANQEQEPWVKLSAMHPFTRYVVFLLPAAKGEQLWQKEPKVMVVELGQEDGGSMALWLCNFSNKKLKWKLDEKKALWMYPIEKKKMKLRGIEKNALFSIKVEAELPKKWARRDNFRVVPHVVKIYVVYEALPLKEEKKLLGFFTAVYVVPQE